MARIHLNDISKIQDLEKSNLKNLEGQGPAELTGTMGEIPLTGETPESKPLYNTPNIDYFRDDSASKLSIALGTNQNGRIFQDRSFLFDVIPD